MILYATVDLQPFIDYCLFCDDPEDCLYNSLATYASACGDPGVLLQNWRDNFCRELSSYTSYHTL